MNNLITKWEITGLLQSLEGEQKINAANYLEDVSSSLLKEGIAVFHINVDKFRPSKRILATTAIPIALRLFKKGYTPPASQLLKDIELWYRQKLQINELTFCEEFVENFINSQENSMPSLKGVVEEI